MRLKNTSLLVIYAIVAIHAGFRSFNRLMRVTRLGLYMRWVGSFMARYHRGIRVFIWVTDKNGSIIRYTIERRIFSPWNLDTKYCIDMFQKYVNAELDKHSSNLRISVRECQSRQEVVVLRKKYGLGRLRNEQTIRHDELELVRETVKTYAEHLYIHLLVDCAKSLHKMATRE